MSEQISVPLTDDEATVLQLAASGQSMIAIGRWEAPVKSLLKRGFLEDASGDTFNCFITDAGRAAMSDEEVETDRAIGHAVDAMRNMATAQKSIREMAEQSAQVLAEIAKLSSAATGDAPRMAAAKWGEVIINRAKELLR